MFNRRKKQFISAQQRKIIDHARDIALGENRRDSPEEALLDLLDVVDSLEKKAESVLKIANELEIDV